MDRIGPNRKGNPASTGAPQKCEFSKLKKKKVQSRAQKHTVGRGTGNATIFFGLNTALSFDKMF